MWHLREAFAVFLSVERGEVFASASFVINFRVSLPQAGSDLRASFKMMVRGNGPLMAWLAGPG